MAMRKRVVLTTISVGRRCLKNTWLVRLLPAGAVVQGLLRFSHGDAEAVTEFRGLELAVPVGSGSIAAGVLGGFYERLELDLFEQLCLQSRVVVDVGANLGVYACLAARRLPADSLLVCLEPVPANATLLRANLARNRRPGLTAPEVLVQQLAAGETGGEVTLRLTDDIGLHMVAMDGAGSLHVPQVALDRHLRDLFTARPGPDRVDVLKIDVEGYDGHVLRGARRILEQDRPALFVEFSVPQLARCGFAAEEFVELLAEFYPEVHLVDETHGQVVGCPPRELLRSKYRNRLVNVVAVARPEQLGLVRAWAAGPADARRLCPTA